MNSLTNTLNLRMNKYSCNDGAWVQFVRDHHETIRAQALLIPISLEDQMKYQYRLREFLKDKGYDAELDWMVMWLNQIPSGQDFTGISNLIIPPLTMISELRSKYETVKVTDGTQLGNSGTETGLKRWY